MTVRNVKRADRTAGDLNDSIDTSASDDPSALLAHPGAPLPDETSAANIAHLLVCAAFGSAPRPLSTRRNRPDDQLRSEDTTADTPEIADVSAVVRIAVLGNGACATSTGRAKYWLAHVFDALSPEIRHRLRGRTIELNIVPPGRKISDLPGFQNTSRENDESAALTRGTRIAVYAQHLNAETVHHEAAHIIYPDALSPAQQVEVERHYALAHIAARWVSDYAATNHCEYFAECTAAFFGAGDSDNFHVDWLRNNDPGTYALLSKVFGGA